ncbi:hypothetical protein F4802DRAFT_555131 [Xylaria palmicola]|nr:hypothetical protein F4802DRAFT_555131 [Xylaria palmicola]
MESRDALKSRLLSRTWDPFLVFHLGMTYYVIIRREDRTPKPKACIIALWTSWFGYFLLLCPTSKTYSCRYVSEHASSRRVMPPLSPKTVKSSGSQEVGIVTWIFLMLGRAARWAFALSGSARVSFGANEGLPGASALLAAESRSDLIRTHL